MKILLASSLLPLTAALIVLTGAPGENYAGEPAAEAAQHAETIDALATLRQAEALLATGDSDGVDDDLLGAEAVLSGRTRLDVEAAREALARSDLFAARQYLATALAERRALR